MFLNDTLLLHIPSFVFWKDLDGRFLGCNERFLKEIAGLEVYEDLVGKSDFDLPSRVNAEGYVNDDRTVIENGVTIKRVEKIPLPNGQTMISETIKTPILLENEIVGLLGICHDITERVRAEELSILVEKQKIVQNEQVKYQRFMKQLGLLITPIEQLINNFKNEMAVDSALGAEVDSNIELLSHPELTEFEHNVLYYMSIGKSGQELSMLLSKRYGRAISAETIDKIIRETLYAKFNVQTNRDLIERAKLIGILPFLLDFIS